MQANLMVMEYNVKKKLNKYEPCREKNCIGSFKQGETFHVCSSTETSYRFEILILESVDVILSSYKV